MPDESLTPPPDEPRRGMSLNVSVTIVDALRGIVATDAKIGDLLEKQNEKPR